MQEKREVAYGVSLRRVNCKNDYITNLMNGRYYLARYNMMAQQITDKTIVEKIDSAPKTVDLMLSEAILMKMRAIKSLRTAHFSKVELQKEFGLSVDDIIDLENDYYNGTIIRDDYDEEYKSKNKAEFVNTSKD